MNPGVFRHAPPKANSLIEALRGLGYTAATALADIIDNSIAARANKVDILFTWSGPTSSIRVLDNGNGMDERELDRAMRLGDISPLETRDPLDLGRFGLGLKTASFSQCRRLTVSSRKNGRENCLRWDLDLLAASSDGNWCLFEGPAIGSESLQTPLNSLSQGVLVLWENLDRIVTAGFGEQQFLNMIDRVERHLAMVFHRYLAGHSPRLRLSINGKSVVPWDPFLTDHPATWSSPIERLPTDCGTVEVQSHVLPHRDRLEATEYEMAAGSEGWTGHQGFYVYRNERLLVGGSWLGLGRGRSWTKEEAYRLARIRLDISNSADTAWKIDIRKATTRPPVFIRERLTRIAEDTRGRARRVFAHRGEPARTARGGAVAQAWRAEHFSGGVRYRIDRNHPAVRVVLEEAPQGDDLIHAMLRIIEETVPVQRIWLDTAEARETPRTDFAGDSISDISTILTAVYRNMILRKGMAPERAREILLHTEPFSAHPQLVATLPDTLPT